MTDRIIKLAGESFVQVIIFTGAPNYVSFRAGRKIAIEKFGIFTGAHEFRYEVNSRSMGKDGNPMGIATTKDVLENEFIEPKAFTRLAIPVTFGDDGSGNFSMALGRDIRPTIFETRELGDIIGWEINVTEMIYHGTATGAAVATTSAMRGRQMQQGKLAAANAAAIADGQKARLAVRTGAAGDPSHKIAIFIQSSALNVYKEYHNKFDGVSDVVGYDKSILDKIKDFFR